MYDELANTWVRGVAFTVLERCDALKGDAEFVGVEETRRIVEEFDVLMDVSLLSLIHGPNVRVS